MTAYLLSNHLLNFLAPAALMAVLLGVFSRLFFGFVGSKKPFAHSWRAQLAINFVVGVMVLTAGLVLLGRDGKMLMYGSMVAACAFTLWWQGFGPGRMKG